MKFLLNNAGKIWTRSYSENGSRTEMQLRDGWPEESTHIIGKWDYRFHVSCDEANATDEEVEAAYEKLKAGLSTKN